VPVSSEPFTLAEVRAILAVADQMVHLDRHGFDDAEFYGRMVRVFLTFGVHPSVLPRLTSANLERRPTERGDRWYLNWRAPKEQRVRRDMSNEVPEGMMIWLPGFLDEPKFETRRGYGHAFDRVGERLALEGYTIHMNPRRARHTTATVQLELGFTEIDVEAGIGVTSRTLRTYGKSTPEQRGAKAERTGFGTW